MRRLRMLCCVCLLAGCSRPPAVKVENGDKPAAREETLAPALDVVRQGSEVRHFRDALTLLNAHLAKQEGKLDLHLTEAARKHLESSAGLDAADLEHVDAGTFRPLDAVHLDSSFLFHAAVRALDLGELAPVEQARAAFAWTTRRVLLHDQVDDDVPPYLVAKRGYGGVRDRALVFLELIRQLQLDGCVVALPAAQTDGAETLLAGVLLPGPKGDDVALFDPRLGTAIAGAKGEAVATLAAVKAQPELLKAAGIEARAEQATARLVYPLPALAPRMKFLEDALSVQERVTLFRDAAALHERVAAAGLKVGAWPQGTVPVHTLRGFLPREEGGRDETLRLPRFTRTLAPVASVIDRLQELRVWFDVPDEGRVRLSALIGALFARFYQEPRDLLVRGQYDAALQRIERIGSAIEQAEFAVPIEEAQFQRRVAEWRERLRDAQLSGDARRLAQFWTEDQYLLVLLDVNNDLDPQKLARLNPKQLDTPQAVAEEQRRRMLTHILLRATREPLGNMVEYVKAGCWDEKAAKLEMRRQRLQAAGSRVRSAEDNAHHAWRNTAGAWDKYLERATLTPAQVRQRLLRVAEHGRSGKLELAVSGLEQLHLELHQMLDGKLRRAAALAQVDQAKAARQLRAEVRDSVTALEKDGELAQALTGLRAHPDLPPPLARRLDLLARDAGPRGHLAALRQRAETDDPNSKSATP